MQNSERIVGQNDLPDDLLAPRLLQVRRAFWRKFVVGTQSGIPTYNGICMKKGNLYLPLNCAGLFSRNAFTPS